MGTGESLKPLTWIFSDEGGTRRFGAVTLSLYQRVLPSKGAPTSALFSGIGEQRYSTTQKVCTGHFVLSWHMATERSNRI